MKKCFGWYDRTSVYCSEECPENENNKCFFKFIDIS